VSDASDFLNSFHLVDTECLIADSQTPARSGVELYRGLLHEGYSIRIILVTAYPDDFDRAQALIDGLLCYLRKPIDEEHPLRCLRAAPPTAQPPEKSPSAGAVGIGNVNRNTAPRGSFAPAHNRPPWAWMIDRHMASPMPTPFDFVV
jgi:DNA-binding response OmpR family regulator